MKTSNTTAVISDLNDHSSAYKKLNSKMSPAHKMTSSSSLATHLSDTESSHSGSINDFTNSSSSIIHDTVNLDQLNDEDVYPPFEWWNINKNELNPPNETQGEAVCVDVQISSCNYCENCHSYLYDEDIMAAWSLNDSQLDIKCYYCTASLVPNLYIRIQDLDSIRNYIVYEGEEDDVETLTTPMTPMTPTKSITDIQKNDTETDEKRKRTKSQM
jgi:hypothetical protein